MSTANTISKLQTGITGFDEIVDGGLPRGRLVVVLGGPGSGKTVFGMQVLVNRAAAGEPGVFVSFEERPEHIHTNIAGFRWKTDEVLGDTVRLLDAQLPGAMVRTEGFDTQGLLAVVQREVDAVGAQHVVLDGLDGLLFMLDDPAAVRAELMRLRTWLLDAGLTGILTAKRDAGLLLDLLTYFGDRVCELDRPLAGRTATRNLRIRKYRGSSHSSDVYPFVIDRDGMVITGAAPRFIEHPVSGERVSSGVPELDEMLGGGYFRGSSMLITGAPGTAKSSLAAAYLHSACGRGERSLYVSFDEAADQILRNMRSIGLDLRPFVEDGTLEILSLRTRSASADWHVRSVREAAAASEARNLVIDPISALGWVGADARAHDAAIEVVDFAKSRGITLLSTTLTPDDPDVEATEMGLSTVADTWLLLSYSSAAGERNRALQIVKSRGMAHSNQVRELVLGAEGLSLKDVFTAGGEVLMGTLRWEAEEAARTEQREREREMARRRAELRATMLEMDARITALTRERELQEEELTTLESETQRQEDAVSWRRDKIGRLRSLTDSQRDRESSDD